MGLITFESWFWYCLGIAIAVWTQPEWSDWLLITVGTAVIGLFTWVWGIYREVKAEREENNVR